MLSFITLNVTMLSVILLSVTQHHAACHDAECHYAECHYAECHYAECHYAECHDVKQTEVGFSFSLTLTLVYLLRTLLEPTRVELFGVFHPWGRLLRYSKTFFQ